MRWKPCGFRSSSPSMLLTCTPVPGTYSPEPVPLEQVTEAHIPSPSSTERWVVEPSRSPGPPAPPAPPIHSPALIRVATPSRRPGSMNPSVNPGVVEPLVEVLLAVGVGCFGGGDDLLHATAVAEALEQPEGVGDQEPPEEGGGLVSTSQSAEAGLDRLALRSARRPPCRPFPASRPSPAPSRRPCAPPRRGRRARRPRPRTAPARRTSPDAGRRRPRPAASHPGRRARRTPESR